MSHILQVFDFAIFRESWNWSVLNFAIFLFFNNVKVTLNSEQQQQIIVNNSKQRQLLQITKAA